MKLLLTTEHHEMIPDRLLAQIKRGLAQVIDNYGFRPNISVDRSAQMEADARYWAWMKQEQEKGG